MMRRGFTLLEVVVALAVLGVSLVAILDVNAQAIQKHVYAKKLSVATLLARGKMVDLEQKLHDTGLSADDEEDAGDFGEEGWPSYKWRAKIIAPKTNGLTPEQLFGALLNLPLGDGKDGPSALLGGLFGTPKKPGADSASKAGPGGKNDPSALMSSLGPMAGMASMQFTQMVDQIQRAVREVHLTVTWKEGRLTESLDLVTHVVSLGRGSDRNGGAAAAAGAPGAAQSYLRPDGTPARQPQPCPTGVGMCDNDGSPLTAGPQGPR